MAKFKENEFIKSFYSINGDKYKYLGYEKGLVSFLCKKHNEIHYDTPSHLLSGRGCKTCGAEKRMQVNILANEKARKEFVSKARKIHGDKYDYSKVNYIKANTKVTLICPKHGEFSITPNSHLNGRGCRRCSSEENGNRNRKSLEQFIKEAKKIHGDKYDYSKVDYRNDKTEVTIICPIHGEFKQKPSKHLIGHGCQKCGRDKIAKMQSFTTEDFIKRARQIHGDKYDYSKVEYKGYDTEVCIICPTHGEFWQTPDSHLQGSGCQRCGNRLSKQENELYEFIADSIGKENVIKSNNSILSKHSEIDIFIPLLNLGIEYNGCRWHTEQFGRTKYYHLKKTDECAKMGISLIQIFEDEYNDKKEIVLNKIKHLLHIQNLPKIAARKCKVCEITYDESKEFLEKNHIQGSQKATLYLGAKYGEELVGVMTFIKWKEDEWELNRFASSNKYLCQGIGGKIFSYFIKNYHPQLVKSFADRRWTISESNNLYTKLGFKLKEILEPDYKYVISGNYKRIHKFNFRKQILNKKYGFDLSMAENKMAEKLKAYRIWDCGLFKYVWTKE